MMKMAEIAASYMRVSTTKQSQINHYSLAMQSQLISDYCKDKNIALEHELQDVGSGGNTNRPSLKLLFQLIEREEITLVLCYKYSRLSRNVSDFLTIMQKCAEHNVRVVSITEQTSGTYEMKRFQAHMYAILAEFERETIRSNQKQSYFQKMSEGQVISSKVPYGYFWDKDSACVSIVASEASIVRQIYDLYLMGYGFRRIAKVVKMEPTTVRNILINPRYSGVDENSYGKNKFPAIIEKESFQRVQVIRTDKARKVRPTPNQSILKHKVICPICGRFLSCERQKRRSKVHEYLSCSNKKHPSFRMNATNLEAQLRPILDKAIQAKSVANQLKGQTKVVKNDPIQAYLNHKITKAEMQQLIEENHDIPTFVDVRNWLQSAEALRLVETILMTYVTSVVVDENKNIQHVWITEKQITVDLKPEGV